MHFAEVYFSDILLLTSPISKATILNYVIARYEAIPNYTEWLCQSGIASYLAMTFWKIIIRNTS
jgi:hypothetical protein